MTSITKLVCNLMRYNEQNEWVQLATQSFVTLIANSISIRDLHTNTLQADLPLTSVQSIDMIETSCLVRITTSLNCLLALKFETIGIYNEFKLELSKEKIVFNDLVCNNSTVLPNLRLPHVQEYILRLLFSDNFRLVSCNGHLFYVFAVIKHTKWPCF